MTNIGRHSTKTEKVTSLLLLLYITVYFDNEYKEGPESCEAVLSHIPESSKYQMSLFRVLIPSLVLYTYDL